jgi:hypothetical protein
MNNHAIRKTLAFAFTLCLMAGALAVGVADDVGISEFQAMRPVMDLAASAAVCASDFPTVISDEESTLDSNYITFFFTNGLLADPSLGITEAMLTDTSLQEAYLKSVFSAKLPELSAITPPETLEDYIGFLPVYAETAEDGNFYLMGELYRGPKAIDQMTTEDYKYLFWIEPAIFTLQPDSAARGGYLIDGFSVESMLIMELQLQDYNNRILVEYSNSKLGFSLLYPSLFKEANFTENANGASAVTADSSASFMVKREENTAGIGLSGYATQMAEAAADARLTVNDMFNYATVAYETADGTSVFSVYFVTDKYIYEAQMTYPTDQSVTYSMYTLYLENSFVVDEVSVG